VRVVVDIRHKLLLVLLQLHSMIMMMMMMMMMMHGNDVCNNQGVFDDTGMALQA